MGIETKSIAALLDEFTTNQIRCWFAQEKNFEVNGRIERGELSADDPEAYRLKAEAADLAQSTNKRRNQLMRAIDAYFEDPNAQLPKSYDPTPAPVDKQQERIELLEYQLQALADAVLGLRAGGNPVQIADVSLQVLRLK